MDMAVTSERIRHDATVTMRMPQQTKDLIETAAHLLHKTLSAFVLESASKHAVDVLLDQTVFSLSAQDAEAFARVLDNPPVPTAKLRELMQSKSPWEK